MGLWVNTYIIWFLAEHGTDFQDNLHDHPQDGLQQNFQDHSLFVPTSPQGHVLLSLYIDDMIVIGDDTAGIADTNRYLHNQFQMKDLDHLRYFLGLEIAQAERGILISQQNYSSDIIDVVELIDSRYSTRASFEASYYRWYTT